MKLTEFWSRMEEALGPGYHEYWASTQVHSDLGGRTVTEALDSGMDPKEVWRVVWAIRDLPANQR